MNLEVPPRERESNSSILDVESEPGTSFESIVKGSVAVSPPNGIQDPTEVVEDAIEPKEDISFQEMEVKAWKHIPNDFAEVPIIYNGTYYNLLVQDIFHPEKLDDDELTIEEVMRQLDKCTRVRFNLSRGYVQAKVHKKRRERAFTYWYAEEGKRARVRIEDQRKQEMSDKVRTSIGTISSEMVLEEILSNSTSGARYEHLKMLIDESQSEEDLCRMAIESLEARGTHLMVIAKNKGEPVHH